MTDYVDDWFREQNQFFDRRRDEVIKWIKHHEACLKELREQLEQIDRVPRSYDEMIERVKKK